MSSASKKSSAPASLRRTYGHDSSDDEAAPVVVFDESSYGIRKKDPNSLSGSKALRTAQKIDLDTSNVVPLSKAHVMDAEDIADLEVSELWDRMKNSVEDLATSALSARDRRSHMLEKTARLSGHAISKPRTPFKILKGMREKAKVRGKRAKEEARVTDSVVAVKTGSIAVGTKTKRAKRAKRI